MSDNDNDKEKKSSLDESVSIKQERASKQGASEGYANGADDYDDDYDDDNSDGEEGSRSDTGERVSAGESAGVANNEDDEFEALNEKREIKRENKKYSKYIKGYVFMDELYAVAVREGHRSRTWINFLLEVFIIITLLPFLLLQSNIIERYDMNELLVDRLTTHKFLVQAANPDHIVLGEDQLLVPITFYEISSKVEFWGWVNDVFFPLIYAGQYSDRIEFNNHILWGIRFRQVRVQKYPQCVLGMFEDVSCYPPFESQWEATADGFYGPVYKCSKGNSTIITSYPKDCNGTQKTIVSYLYNWESEFMLGDQPFHGKYGTYPGSGFAVVLPMIPQSARNRINQMMSPNTEYIDLQTRFIVISFSIFNTNTNSLSYVEIVFEQAATGAWSPTLSVDTAVFWTTRPVQVAIGVFLIISHLLFAWFCLKQLSYYMSAKYDAAEFFWMLIDFTSIALYIYAIVFAFMFYTGLGISFFSDLDTSMIEFANQNGNNTFTYIQDGNPYFFSGAASVLKDYTTVQYVYCWILVFCSIRLCHYISILGEFEAINRTLRASFVSIIFYFLFVCFMLVSYAFAAMVALGLRFDEFRTMTYSFMTLISYFAFGVNYYDVFTDRSVGNVFYPIFLVGYIVLFVFLFLPIFIGILYSSWASEIAQMKREETEAKEKEKKSKSKSKSGVTKRYGSDLSRDHARRVCCCCCSDVIIPKRSEAAAAALKYVTRPPKRNQGCVTSMVNFINEIFVFFGFPQSGWIPDTLIAPRLISWYKENRPGPIISFEQIRTALTGKRTDSYNGYIETRQIVYLLRLCDEEKLITEDELRKLKDSGIDGADIVSGLEISNKVKGGNERNGQILLTGPDESTIRRLESVLDNLEFDDRMKTAYLEARIRTLAMNQARIMRLLEHLER